MTGAAPAYRRVAWAHVNKWDPLLQDTVSGWEGKFLWVSTGNILPVFIDDAHYTPENLDALVRAAGALEDATHKLGG